QPARVWIGEEGDAAAEGSVPEGKAPRLQGLRDEMLAREPVVEEVAREKDAGGKEFRREEKKGKPEREERRAANLARGHAPAKSLGGRPVCASIVERMPPRGVNSPRMRAHFGLQAAAKSRRMR